MRLTRDSVTLRSENKYYFVEHGVAKSTWVHTAQLSYQVDRNMEVRTESLWVTTRDTVDEHRLLYSYYW